MGSDPFFPLAGAFVPVIGALLVTPLVFPLSYLTDWENTADVREAAAPDILLRPATAYAIDSAPEALLRALDAAGEEA
jgi:hypothetical protein